MMTISTLGLIFLVLLAGTDFVAATIGMEMDYTSAATAEDLFKAAARKMRVKGSIRQELQKSQMNGTAPGSSFFEAYDQDQVATSALAASQDKAVLTPVEKLVPYKDQKSALGLGPWISKYEADRLAASFTRYAWRRNLEAIVQGPGHDDLHWNTRVTGSEGAAKAARYLASQMEKAGLDVFTDQIDTKRELAAVLGTSPKDLQKALGDPKATGHLNVLGRLHGREKCVVLLGAHYDSINNAGGKKGDAPGADDNGSGVATLLMAARALASTAKQKKPRCNVIFAAFVGEEQGLLGSSHLVKTMVKTKTLGDFKGALIMDQVGFQEDGKRELIFETSGETKENAILIDTLAKTTDEILLDANDKPVLGKYEVNYHGFGSDHMSFLSNGLPAVLLIERQNLLSAHKFGHSERDRLENIDYDFGAQIAILVMRVVAKMADQTPMNVVRAKKLNVRTRPGLPESPMPRKQQKKLKEVEVAAEQQHKTTSPKQLLATKKKQKLPTLSASKATQVAVTPHTLSVPPTKTEETIQTPTLPESRPGRGLRPSTAMANDSWHFGALLALSIFLLVSFGLLGFVYLQKTKGSLA